MEVTLPPDLEREVEQELAAGHFRDSGELVEHALRQFLDGARKGQPRVAALDRLGEAVDRAGLYERVLVPDNV